MEQRLADVYSGKVGLILIWDDEKESARALIGYSLLQRGSGQVAQLVWMAGAGRRDWLHLYDEIEQWARDAGCVGMAALARPGWAPDLKKWGYKLKHVEY